MNSFFAMYDHVGRFFTRGVGMILLIAAFYSVGLRAVDQELTKVVSLGIGMFGVVAALAALAFSYKDAVEEQLRGKVVWAAENLFHGSMLIVLVVFCRFAESELGDSTTWHWSVSGAGLAFLKLSKLLLSTVALTSTTLGFSGLNDVIWQRADERKKASQKPQK